MRAAAPDGSRRSAGFSHDRALWRRRNPEPRRIRVTATTRPTRSRSSRAWKRCGDAPRCTSDRSPDGDCTTSSTKSSTTRSTRRWPATPHRSTSPSIPTMRSPWSTTAAASPSILTRPRKSPGSRWRSRCSTPGASSTRARAPTRAGCAEMDDLTIHPDDAIPVVDNGRGIPVDTHKTEKKPGVEVALTVLHAGGKFDKSTYKVSGGLHGVGVSVVNALSEQLEVWVDRDGKRHHMAFERGETKKKLEVIGKAKGTGTTVWFKPDSKIFTETRFDYATIATRLRELAFLNKALTITLRDERKGQQKQETFYYKGGLAEFVKPLLGNRKTLHPKPIVFETTRDGVVVEGAIQYDDGYNDNTLSFVNNINTHEGGTHLTGFRAALMLFTKE